MDYKTIKTDVFSNVTEVRLYDETIEHIKEEHKELPIDLPCVQEALTSAIKSPTSIEESYNDSYVYVDAETTNASGDPLRVPVKRIDGGKSARVKTAFFASTDDDAPVVWSRS